MNNRVFNNSIRVVKDVHLPWTIAAFENNFEALVQLTTGTDRQSRVESKVKTNSLVAVPTLIDMTKPACMAAISHKQYSFLLEKRFLLEKWGRIK